jgi:hypothetical protein
VKGKRYADYLVRNSAVRRMGFKSYGEYLRSDLWRSIRGRVLSRDGQECYSCGGRATQVHHRQYSEAALRGDDLTEMRTICRPCHEEIEFNKTGVFKTTLDEANARLEELRENRDRTTPPRESPFGVGLFADGTAPVE